VSGACARPVLRSAYRRQARAQGLAGGETGMVTSIQRFGGAVNAHLHFHTLAIDGVFAREPDDTLHFHPAAPPIDDDVRRVVARVRRRLERLGLTGATTGDADVDPLGEESPALAGLPRAAILGRAALGQFRAAPEGAGAGRGGAGLARGTGRSVPPGAPSTTPGRRRPPIRSPGRRSSAAR
jgi:hypothetical protein